MVALAPSSATLSACSWRQHGLEPAVVGRPEELQALPVLPRALVVESHQADGADAWPFATAARGLGIPFFFVAHSSGEALAISALRAGAVDYFRPPIDHQGVCHHLRQYLARDTRSEPPGPHSADHPLTPNAAGAARAHDYIAAQIERAAAAPSCVLITGETGTGKEVAAGRIHAAGPRKAGPFVSVNCAAIPDTLVESELFGYERGSFTGAATSMDGKWQQADGGTLFLDEVGDMSPLAQAKILRALESREITRLGARRATPVNVRIVAATNHDPEVLVSEGRFRRDLYYRLNVIRIHLAPLRERTGEIRGLVGQFVREMNQRFAQDVTGLTEQALQVLAMHEWPGNVRELRNVVESVFVDLPAAFRGTAGLPPHVARRMSGTTAANASERARLLATLEETHWNVTRAAHKLEWSRMTVYRKIAKYRLARSAGS